MWHFARAQTVVMCKDNDKLRLLEDQLADVEEKRVIVFVNTKTHCDTVSRHLDHLGYRCTVLHGGKTQARPCPRCTPRTVVKLALSSPVCLHVPPSENATLSGFTLSAEGDKACQLLWSTFLFGRSLLAVAPAPVESMC